MARPTRFTLTEQHLALLKRANIRWEPYGRDGGGPAVDGKRPYGNEDWVTDICEILAFPKRDNSEYGEEDEVYSRTQCATATRLHRETETALTICLQHLSFTPGAYELKGQFNYSDWTLVNDDDERKDA